MERTFGYPPSASLEEKWKGKALGFIIGAHKMGGEGWGGRAVAMNPSCSAQRYPHAPVPLLPRPVWGHLSPFALDYAIRLRRQP